MSRRTFRRFLPPDTYKRPDLRGLRSSQARVSMHEGFYRLVPRYSRSSCGVVILYGAKHPATLFYTTFEEMEMQMTGIIERRYLARSGLNCSRDQMLVFHVYYSLKAANHFSFPLHLKLVIMRGTYRPTFERP